jgi:hypothetical protein
LGDLEVVIPVAQVWVLMLIYIGLVILRLLEHYCALIPAASETERAWTAGRPPAGFAYETKKLFVKGFAWSTVVILFFVIYYVILVSIWCLLAAALNPTQVRAAT